MIIASLITSDASLNRNYPNPNLLNCGVSGSPGMRVLVRLGTSSSTESNNVNNSKPIKIFGLTSLGAFLMFDLFLGLHNIGSYCAKQTQLRHQEDDHAGAQR